MPNECVDGPNIAFNVDDVGADEQLVAWAMDKTIGIRPNNAGRVLMQLHGLIDIVEPRSGPAILKVSNIGNDPEPIGPRHQRPGSGFRSRAMIRYHGESGKHTAHFDAG